ncbi:hypothetical protein LCGC14_0686180 [marine sediment metagenome]|uniref:DUF6950 domain-containing protein n=1 Tax=marine sediment metagenome TaxID=412755 RepID=A0A0F9T808_9ZZZZ
MTRPRLERVENWDSRLVEFAREVTDQPFEWGVTDCASLARRGLEVVFGLDLWRGHVGTWKTRRGALGVSGRTEHQEALRASGAVEVGKHYAWSADVALGDSVDDHGMLQVALLLPTRKAMTSTPERGVLIVDKLSLAEGTTFWRYTTEETG